MLPQHDAGHGRGQFQRRVAGLVAAATREHDLRGRHLVPSGGLAELRARRRAIGAQAGRGCVLGVDGGDELPLEQFRETLGLGAHVLALGFCRARFLAGGGIARARGGEARDRLGTAARIERRGGHGIEHHQHLAGLDRIAGLELQAPGQRRDRRRDDVAVAKPRASLGIAASAQPVEFSVRHWTTADGLPSHSINTIVEGPKGYLWLTSQGGVVRFDGHQFAVLGESHGLRGNRFHSLFVTAAGQLLVSGADGALYRLDGSRFERIADGFIVRMMGETADGTLWGANTVQRARLSAEGVWRDHTPTETFPHVDGETRFVWSGNVLDFTGVTRVLQPATGMWFRSRRSAERVIVEAEGGGPQYDVPGSPAPELRLVDRDGLLWGTDGGRVRAFRSASRIPVATLVLPDVDRINDLYQSADGLLWFGTETAGLFGARKSPTRVMGA